MDNCSEMNYAVDGYKPVRVDVPPREWPMVNGHICQDGSLDADLIHCCPRCFIRRFGPTLDDDWWNGRDIGDR